jgi:chromatin remodeling complex protein RSC6
LFLTLLSLITISLSLSLSLSRPRRAVFGSAAQNPNDKREILCDDKLAAIMGGQNKVTMFNMNRFITQHLIEKLDRSAYNHEESAGAAAANMDEPEGDSDEEDDDEEDDYSD